MKDIEEDETNKLRTEAEALIAREPIALVNPQPGEELLHKLLHELQVHQVELKMQNDELRQAQIAMEASRDSYVDLFDFAPVGYITLSREGMISAINLTAADMLGVVRKQLVSRRFSQFVAEEDRDRWHHHFISVIQHEQRQRCELSIQRGDGTRFHARLDSDHYSEYDKSSKPGAVNGWVSIVRVALSDVTERVLSEYSVQSTRALNASIMDTVREPLVVLDGALKVVAVSRSFRERFGLAPGEAEGSRIYDLGGGQWDIPKLKELLETLLPHEQLVQGYELEIDFADTGKRRLLLNARRNSEASGETQSIVLAMEVVAG
ncbi:MAG: PAS domain-containing protein [Sideroxyarcus sp.]|nr:PAS domain-containing protein [Sideroxyarcus sp.]